MLRGSQKNMTMQKIVKPIQNQVKRRSLRSLAFAASTGIGMPH